MSSGVTMNEIEKRWTETAKALEGKTIKTVRYLTEEEADGWFSRSVVIFFDDGSYILPMSDDEGNDAGALRVSHDLIECEVLPVI